ncbi:discoidin domain-containing protein [Uliginosibacterium sp. H3]|uniref:Discoidin domain-containing protein n=1 Tax=Uliginosibacterium silvisoli TaxID=3114758 RepID=A0ABU6K6J2_9RHOO|nr:discoidin domain-containing protein [Uliginosibacterium sp. H3]
MHHAWKSISRACLAVSTPLLVAAVFSTAAHADEVRIPSLYAASSQSGWAHGVEKAGDNNFATRWEAGTTKAQTWIAISFLVPTEVFQLRFKEHESRLSTYKIQILKGLKWITIDEGFGSGSSTSYSINIEEKVSAIRLITTSVGNGLPSFSEFYAVRDTVAATTAAK